MSENSLASLTESMQMYIVTIARLWKDNQPVPLSKLAEFFSISPVSVNEMCRKLQENGLVQYQPYKGASLTPEGEEKASYILRRHRLWEVFLVAKLGFDFDEAHHFACQLEHTTPDELADRLDMFLGYPSENPQGDAIPRKSGALPVVETIPLTAMAVGQKATLSRMEVNETVLQFLQQSGLRIGSQVSPEVIMEEGFLLRVHGGQMVSLTVEIANQIFVSLIQTGTDSLPSRKTNEKAGTKQEEVSMMNSAQTNHEQTITTVQKMPLSKMRVGQQGVVVSVRGKGQVRQRMMDMGVVPGSDVRVIRVAPLGDPIEFSVRGYNLSLRKSEAEEVIVEVIE
ncbi:MAG: hypothetical protein GYA48_11710 [Chloroflexi bacterium]|nr:hypothetical protein [Chloroflexota bacterium]